MGGGTAVGKVGALEGSRKVGSRGLSGRGSKTGLVRLGGEEKGAA